MIVLGMMCTAHGSVLTRGCACVLPLVHLPCRYGVPEPYEKLKAFTRGQRVTQQSMQDFVAALTDLPDQAREELKQLTPWTYVGNAAQQAKDLKDQI